MIKKGRKKLKSARKITKTPHNYWQPDCTTWYVFKMNIFVIFYLIIFLSISKFWIYLSDAFYYFMIDMQNILHERNSKLLSLFVMDFFFLFFAFQLFSIFVFLNWFYSFTNFFFHLQFFLYRKKMIRTSEGVCGPIY